MHDARRWVVQACRDAGRADLADAAELAVSELVTNALLHAEAPIDVRLGGTPEHPRFEVRDGSTVPPEPPVVVEAEPADVELEVELDVDAILDDFDPDSLMTFGRGLTLVARASVAWGADIDDHGKAVWFEPATELSDGPGVPCRITGATDGDADANADPGVEIEIQGVPVDTFQRFQQQYRELRREVRLLALSHEEDYPQAKTLSEVFGSLDRPLRVGMGRKQVEAAEAAGDDTVDLRVRIAREEASGLERLVDVLELADAFCRSERLLSLARSSEQQAFQHWFLTEFIRQADGADPMPWSHEAEREFARRSSAS